MDPKFMKWLIREDIQKYIWKDYAFFKDPYNKEILLIYVMKRITLHSVYQLAGVYHLRTNKWYEVREPLCDLLFGKQNRKNNKKVWVSFNELEDKIKQELARALTEDFNFSLMINPNPTIVKKKSKTEDRYADYDSNEAAKKLYLRGVSSQNYKFEYTRLYKSYSVFQILDYLCSPDTFLNNEIQKYKAEFEDDIKLKYYLYLKELDSLRAIEKNEMDLLIRMKDIYNAVSKYNGRLIQITVNNGKEAYTCRIKAQALMNPLMDTYTYPPYQYYNFQEEKKIQEMFPNGLTANDIVEMVCNKKIIYKALKE